MSKGLHLNQPDRGSWLPRSEECETLDLGIVGSSPTLGVATTKKKKGKILFN